MTRSIPAHAETVPLDARRFEASPFAPRYTGPETVLGVYAGRFYPLTNGEDAVAEYWTLRRKAVLYDVPERPLDIEGPDALALMERLFARPIADLKAGRGRYVVACTPRGGLFMDGVLFRLGPRRFRFVQPDGPFEAWVEAHGAGFDVRVTDPRSRVLQVQGPAAPAILSAASGGATEGLKYFHAGTVDLGGQRVFVSRTGWTGELGYEVYTEAGTDALALWDHLVAAGAPHGLAVGSIASMGIRRIEAGILDSGTDFDSTMTPFAAGLGGVVRFENPHFLGRAALLRAERGRSLHGLRCEGARPVTGSLVLAAGRPVGRVTSGAWSPCLECGVGFVRLEGPAGAALEMELPSGERHACALAEVPFIDPEKRIPRGLDGGA